MRARNSGLGGVPVGRFGEIEDTFGPFTVLHVPGHADDHLVFVAGRAAFTGDAVLGEGSVFVAPGEGSLSSYLASLERLLELELDAICPGHGPVVRDPAAKLNQREDARQIPFICVYHRVAIVWKNSWNVLKKSAAGDMR